MFCSQLSLQHVFVVLLFTRGVNSFSVAPSKFLTTTPSASATHIPKAHSQTTDDGESSEDDNDAATEPEIVQTSEDRIDDGGSDLTDRFKYKVSGWRC